MASLRTTFSPIFYVTIFLLLAVFQNTPVHAGCPRGVRCSGKSGLRRDLRNTIAALFDSSRLLAGLTSRALNYTNFEYNVTDSCSPACNSLILAVMSDMNLTSSTWTTTSRSNLLEFYRRANLGYSKELTQSVAELSRLQKVTTSPAYLKSLKDFMQNTFKNLIIKAVNRDRKLKGLPALSTTAGQQHSFTPVRPQSVSAVACHISQCVLDDLYVVANQMLIDLLKMKSSL